EWRSATASASRPRGDRRRLSTEDGGAADREPDRYLVPARDGVLRLRVRSSFEASAQPGAFSSGSLETCPTTYNPLYRQLAPLSVHPERHVFCTTGDFLCAEGRLEALPHAQTMQGGTTRQPGPASGTSRAGLPWPFAHWKGNELEWFNSAALAADVAVWVGLLLLAGIFVWLRQGKEDKTGCHRGPGRGGGGAPPRTQVRREGRGPL